MKLGEAILTGNPAAWGRLADKVRSMGGTYRDTYEWVCIIHHKAGREIPSLAEFDEILREADEE